MTNHFLTPEELKIASANNVNLQDNFIVIKDAETGKTLSVQNNLVALSGRTLALRKLFNVLPAGTNQDGFDQRSVCLFSIGSGGTPTSDPFKPTPPVSSDVQLNTAVPFRVTNTSTGVSLTTDEQSWYTDAQAAGSMTKFFKKKFRNIELVENTSRNEVYVKISLEISEKDARGSLISELGLFSAKKNGNVFTDYELFSRVTFQTEPLNDSLNKALLINYYVFC